MWWSPPAWSLRLARAEVPRQTTTLTSSSSSSLSSSSFSFSSSSASCPFLILFFIRGGGAFIITFSFKVRRCRVLSTALVLFLLSSLKKKRKRRLTIHQFGDEWHRASTSLSSIHFRTGSSLTMYHEGNGSEKIPVLRRPRFPWLGVKRWVHFGFCGVSRFGRPSFTT